MTTGAVAKKTGRNYTMIEMDLKYVNISKIDTVVPEIGDVENAVFDIKPPKVSVAEMVKAGYLK